MVVKAFMEVKQRLRDGEKGFTLVEILVVVAILGIVAAVVVPNVNKFLSSSAVDAANGEAYNVAEAVVAAMADNHVVYLADDGTVGPGRASALTNTTGIALAVENYFTGGLEATYSLGTDGHIKSAIPDPEGKWKDLTYTEHEGWSQ